MINTLLFLRYRNNEVLASDPTQYHETAIALMHFNVKFPDGSDIAEQITPGYPIFIAIIYSIFGINPIAVYIIQSLLYSATIFIIFFIINKFSENIFALLGAIWIAIYYPLWRMNYSLMMEVLTVFLCTVILLIINKWLKQLKSKQIISLSLLFCVLIFINNRFIFHYSVLIAALIFLKIANFIQINLKQILLSMLIVVIMLGAWHYRQYKVFNEIVIFAPHRIPDAKQNGSYPEFKSFDEYKNDINHGNFSSSSKEKFNKEFTLEKYEELKLEYYQRSKIKILLNRMNAFWQITRKKIEISPGDRRIIPPASSFHNIFELITLLPAFIFAAVGAFYSVRKKNVFYFLIFILIMAHWVLHSLVHYIPRYRLTIIPLIIMLATWGMYNVVLKYRNSKY